MTEKQILELRTSMTDSTYSHIQVLHACIINVCVYRK